MHRAFMAWRTSMRWIALLVAVLAVGGCASTLSAEVTRYQQWPADAGGARYRIVAQPAQAGGLEFQTYADMVRAAIGVTGLVEAQGSEQARFDVSLDYGSPQAQAWVQRAVDPFFPGPYYGAGFGFGRSWGAWGGWGYGPAIETVPVTVYRHTLTLTIRDAQQRDREVYKASAVSASRSDNLTPVMPYLARAVFQGFPGHNAQVIEVEYPRVD